MNSPQERHGYWQNLIEEQEKSGLSRREFCQNRNIVFSQFAYYYTTLKKKKQIESSDSSIVVPIHLRKEPLNLQSEIKVLLPNGLQLVLPCTDENHLKRWMEMLKSC
jgi:hypothetical protein